MIEPISFECRKSNRNSQPEESKISQEPIISESKVETCKVIESRENAGDRVGIGF